MAGDSLAIGGVAGEQILPEITDEVAERLFRSLELMEEDYRRTLAAGRPQEASEDEDVDTAGYSALGSDDGGSEEETDGGHVADWGGFQAAQAAKAVQEGLGGPGGPGGLENFADFGHPAMPLPPASLLEAKFLSRDEIQVIKETMQQIQLPTPTWAQRLSDHDFQRLVQDSLR